MRVRPPSRLSGRLIELAVAVLPAGQRGRYARELYAELYGMTPIQQLRHALRVLTLAWALRAALISQEEQTMTTTTPQRPLRCRLGRHDWDERENPETHELYEICLLCDAYRDHPRAAPGSSSAGLAGGLST